MPRRPIRGLTRYLALIMVIGAVVAVAWRITDRVPHLGEHRSVAQGMQR